MDQSKDQTRTARAVGAVQTTYRVQGGFLVSRSLTLSFAYSEREALFDDFLCPQKKDRINKRGLTLKIDSFNCYYLATRSSH